MKIFISADIEGIAGVMRPEQCSPGHAEYQIARGLMEQEVNAAIDGAFAAGASEVVVADSHAMMTNLRAENIDHRARLLQGKPRLLSMLEGLDSSFSGMMFIGYHSAAGEFGVLAHTINGRAFAQVMINGKVMSECDIYASAGNEQGVPLWLVTGDDILQREIKKDYPQAVEFVCVKRAISQTTAESISPQYARQAIREAAVRAVKAACNQPVSCVSAPYRLQLRASKPVLADLFALIPGVKRHDAVTVGYQAEQMTTLIRLLSVFSYLASTQN